MIIKLRRDESRRYNRLFLAMRQLAAIMFSDMSGYTALMQQNEQLAREAKEDENCAFLKPLTTISILAKQG